MGLHVTFKVVLEIVGRELLAAHGAHLPVAFNVLFKLALVIVGREH